MRFKYDARRKEQTMAKAGIIKNTMLKGMTTGLLAAGLLLAGVASEAAEPNYPQLPELNWEQRSDWLNVKTDVTPAAVGDGVTDDTAALQAAFDRVCADREGRYSTVYLPPGTYRITKTINPVRIGDWRSPEPASLHIRGHGRSTRVVWDGPEGGTMFLVRGFGNSTYIGVVWDGQGKAARGFMHDGGNETHVLHEHQAFMNCTEQGSGVTEGPRPGTGGTDYLEDSEWRNCLFVNCGKGLAIWHYNDFLITINGCEFHDNGFGIWCRRGNFYARNCHFQRSKEADIANPGALHGCSVRRCTSLGSHTFLRISGHEMTVQDCHVSGWTNPDGAIISGGQPFLIFDCVFTNAPSANPPIRLNAPAVAVHSNNKTSTPALFGGATENVVEIPKGQRGGSVTTARQSFFKSEATIPGRVFDARRDFGGDIQRTIDAARQYGRGAIAYFPRGNYNVSQTIHISGGNYYIGGSGRESTRFHLRGTEPIFLVSNPQNVTMEHMAVWARSGEEAIRQVSAVSQPSRIYYDHLNLRGGMNNPRPDTFTDKSAFEAMGLSKGSVLIADGISGSMSFDNCSNARILLNRVGSHSYDTIRLKGKQSDRSGFIGAHKFHTRLRVEDNQSMVIGDGYAENMGLDERRSGPFAHIVGSSNLPEGRVTISYSKMCGNDNKRYKGIPYEEYITVDNYRGRLFGVMSQYFNPTENFDRGEKKAFKIVCTGEAPLEVLLMANAFQQKGGAPGSVPPVIEGAPNVRRHLLGNAFTYSRPGGPVPNVLHADSARLASQALDDFRELGEHDLELNHAEK